MVAKSPAQPVLLYRGGYFNSNFFHYSGVDIDHSFFLSQPRTLFVPKLNRALADKLFSGKVVPYSDISGVLKPFVKGKWLMIDGHTLPASLYKKISGFARLRDCSDMFLIGRSSKKAGEVALIGKAVRATKRIFSGVESRISGFKTEYGLRKFLLMRTLELGSEPAFEPIVAGGPNSRFPHYQSGNDAKLSGLVLVDYGVKYGHYCSDLTRCFFPGRNREIENRYELLKRMFHDIIDSFPDFHSGKDVALFAEKLYARYGLPRPPHSIGHGIGLDVHEFPRLSKKYSDGLKGATMAIEPSVYFRDYGLRFEETVYFDGRKARIL